MKKRFCILSIVLLFCVAARAQRGIAQLAEAGSVSDAVSSGPAQSYSFRHWQVEHGLSNNAVICSLQDKRGFLWFGTKDGLDRYDGYSFKVFRSDADDSGSIGSNFIHCLYEDVHGVLWVGTEKGLYRCNDSTESFSVLPGTEGGTIRDITMDGQGQLWFISGLTLFKYGAGHLSLYPINHYFETTSICVARGGKSTAGSEGKGAAGGKDAAGGEGKSTAGGGGKGEPSSEGKGTAGGGKSTAGSGGKSEAGGQLWASSTSGELYRYEPTLDSFTRVDLFAHSQRTTDQWIEKIYALSDGRILAGTAIHGAKLFDPRSGEYKDILTYNPDGTAVFARNFVQTGPDECWIGTETGIYIYSLSSGRITHLWKKPNDPYSISDNAVYTFCRDHEGGIWAGTYFGGINYYPGQYNPFVKYFPHTCENSISGYVVREIHEDRRGHLWIGTEDAGLNKLDTASGLFTHFQPSGKKGDISYSNIHGLLVHGNELWIGTFEHGLDIMDLSTEKVVRHYGAGTGEGDLRSSFIYCLSQGSAGEVLLGTTRGAYQYDSVHNGFQLLPGMPLNNWYSALLEDPDSIIWGGTYGNGVNYYDSRTRKSGNFRYDGRARNTIASDRINSIFLDSRKRLWFATEGGLCLYQRGTHDFIRYTTKEGLPTNFILSLLEDEKGNLWISTTKGLVCMDPVTGNKTVYTRDNGLLNDQFNFSSAFRSEAGRMYFGSVRGLISFHPAAFTPNTYVPPVYITGVQVDNKELSIGRDGSPLKRSVSYSDKLVLDHSQSSFSLDFAALGFTAPETTEYAYEMEGLDRSWTLLQKNRKVFFTGLAPGHYVFKVKACNSSGIWNQQETRLSIEVLPPWWAGLPAYCVYGASLLLLIAWLVHLYHRRVEEKNKRKIRELETAKEKEILNAKIGFFTNVAHEIRTPLTLIRGPLEKVMDKAGDVPGIKDSLTIMQRNTDRLINLTNQLLDFRQTEIEGFRLSFVRANISALLEETCSSFRPLAEKKGVDMVLAGPAAEGGTNGAAGLAGSGLPGVVAAGGTGLAGSGLARGVAAGGVGLAPLFAYIDVEAFNKILSNLLSNAVKYAARRVEVRLLPPTEKDFSIEVVNDGFLIPYSMKDKIFEPFFRLKETEKQKGTGIGLSLSLSLVQLHKGSLQLMDNGVLNHFVLTLPIHQETEFNLKNDESNHTLSRR